MLVGMIIPGVLVGFLGSLYFILPRGDGSRISFINTIILTEIMFLVMVTQIVPQTKDIPAVAILFLQQTMMLSFLMIVVLIMDKLQVLHNKRIEKYEDAFKNKE